MAHKFISVILQYYDFSLPQNATTLRLTING